MKWNDVNLKKLFSNCYDTEMQSIACKLNAYISDTKHKIFWNEEHTRCILPPNCLDYLSSSEIALFSLYIKSHSWK